MNGTGENRLAQHGLTGRVHMLEGHLTALAEYATEMAHHYNQRVSALEGILHGGDRPEPYFPTFSEWFQKREAEASPRVRETDGMGAAQIRMHQGMRNALGPTERG